MRSMSWAGAFTSGGLMRRSTSARLVVVERGSGRAEGGIELIKEPKRNRGQDTRARLSRERRFLNRTLAWSPSIAA